MSDWTFTSARTLPSVSKQLDMMKAKQTQIDNLIYERGLIEKDLIDTIRTDYAKEPTYNIIYGCNYSKEFDEIQEYFEDKRKHKDTFNFIDHMIKTKLLDSNEEFKMVDVSALCGKGWDSRATYFNFIYEYKNRKYAICIPNYAGVNEIDYGYILDGTLIKYESSEHIWDLVAGDLEVEKVAEKFKKWLNENENKITKEK